MQTHRRALGISPVIRGLGRRLPACAMLAGLVIGCSSDGSSTDAAGSTTNAGELTSGTPTSGSSTTSTGVQTGSTNTQTAAVSSTGNGTSAAQTTSGSTVQTTGSTGTGGASSTSIGGVDTTTSTGGAGTSAGGGETSGGAGGATTSSTAASSTGGTGGTGMTCPLPSTFEWTSTGPLAEPKNSGAKSLKDFSVTTYNGKYLVYATTANGEWNGFMSTFDSFDEWAEAEQPYIPGLVAPTVFYFTPKDTWVLAYQWGFKYATTKTPDDPNSWSPTQSLLTGDPTGGRGTGPIDQTVICDDSDCYLFFCDDAGGVYRGSMPIGNFPGAFSNVTRIMDQPTSVIFEGVQVYSIKGSDKYLMIIENNGTRFFRAWTADSLDGEWTPLEGASSEQQPFAGRNNVTWPGGQWTNDISHGDIVRENPSEKMEIDPCNLQMIYQGRDPNQNPSYIDLPYRPGLLTLVR